MASKAAAPAPRSIKLAIYPYVPRKDQFKSAITEAWRKAEPSVTLHIVDDWDCYSTDPTDDLDVYVFDAIYLDEFQRNGLLEPIPDASVSAHTDFLAYGLDGSRIDGVLYGLPQLGCTNVLFYRRDDAELATCRTLADLRRVLGECTYFDVHPPAGKGLIADLSGSTSAACLYLAAIQCNYGQYTPSPPLPPDPSKIDPWAIQNLHTVVRLASKPGVKYEDPGAGYERAAWFGNGEGRAYIGFTESMSNVPESARAVVALKAMPWCDRDGPSLFFADIIGVNPKAAARGNRELAIKLADLMASTDVILKCIGPSESHGDPQYLMPVRRSVFAALEPSYPLYRDMRQLAESDRSRLFRIAPASRQWLCEMKKAIRTQIQAAPDCSPNATP